MSRVATITIVFLLLSSFAPQILAISGVNTQKTVTPNITTSQVYSTANILVDESHAGATSEIWIPGNASMFGWILGEYDYNMSMNWDESLDSGILDDYDILCLFFPQEELTSGEVTAIQNFVTGGGGLLLVGVDTSTDWQYTQDNLNPVSETYGITFNSDSLMGTALLSDDELDEHHLSDNIDSVHSRNNQIAGCSLTVESPAISVATINDNDYVAYAESGSGRVVAVGSGAPFGEYRRTQGWQVDPDDHFQFTLNVIDWLIGNSPREVDVPELAVIYVGDGPDINSTEMEEYDIFNGVIHEHTRQSDGADTPEAMMDRALEVYLDYFIMTDHSYETEAQNGIVGAQKVKAYRDRYNLDITTTIGAEISRTPHMIGFPMTENIFTLDVQEAVDGIHDQGGIVIMCHPTLSPKHCEPYENCELIGYDGMEVNNRGFMSGLGEAAYNIPFIIASDTHNAQELGWFRNVIFVKNPSGPDGRVSDGDITDAILNKRIVLLDKMNDLVFGQKVWVDRFMEVWEDAETVIEDSQTEIDALELSGENVEFAKLYLVDAQGALNNWNPSRAIRLANDAVSDVILNLTANPIAYSLGTIPSAIQRSISIDLTNGMETNLQFNITPFQRSALAFDQPSYLVEVGANSTESISFSLTPGDYGYARVSLYMSGFNSTYKPKPISIPVVGFIPAVEVTEEIYEGGHNVTVFLPRNSGDHKYINSVSLEYTTDDGTVTSSMENYGNGYGLVIGPFVGETDIMIQITVGDIFGNTYNVNYGLYHVEEDPEPEGDPIMTIIIIGGIASVVVVVLLVGVKSRR